MRLGEGTRPWMVLETEEQSLGFEKSLSLK